LTHTYVYIYDYYKTTTSSNLERRRPRAVEGPPRQRRGRLEVRRGVKGLSRACVIFWGGRSDVWHGCVLGPACDCVLVVLVLVVVVDCPSYIRRPIQPQSQPHISHLRVPRRVDEDGVPVRGPVRQEVQPALELLRFLRFVCFFVERGFGAQNIGSAGRSSSPTTHPCTHSETLFPP
jgi:hypothetical protein